MEDDPQEKQNDSWSIISTHQSAFHPPQPPLQQSSPSSLAESEQRTKKPKLTDPRTQPPNSGPVESPLQAAAAQLRLLKGKERDEYKLTLVGGQPITKKSKRQRGPDRAWTPPGPSPLGSGPSPYDRVKKVVSVLKNYLKLDSPTPGTEAPVTTSMAKPTTEKVILMLDEYVERISRSSTDEEMEELLRVFQRNVDVDDEEICWYGLIKESNEAFWKSLTEHFICETFFDSDLEEEEDEGEE